MIPWHPSQSARPGSRIATPLALRIGAWATIASLIFGVIALGQPVEDVLRTARDMVRGKAASGDVVVVGIDDRSLAELGAWPWPRRHHARLVEQLRILGARRIFFDLEFSHRSDMAGEDVRLARAFAGKGAPVTLAVHSSASGMAGGTSSLPMAMFARHVDLSAINVDYDYNGMLRHLRYAVNIGDKTYRSFSAKLAGVSGPTDRLFKVDFSIEPASVPTVGVIDVLKGSEAASRVAGRDVIVGMTSPTLGDHLSFPGHGRVAGVYVHALGADTLKAGTPREAGWVPAFLIGLMLTFGALRSTTLRRSLAITGPGAVAMMTVPILTDSYQLHVEIFPGLILLTIVSGSILWTRLRTSYRVQGTVNASSGLLNLDALRRDAGACDRILIAARIHNYAQIASALPAKDEAALIAQVAKRLTLGRPDQVLYQGDEGIFAWFSAAPDIVSVGEHLDALHGFFRSSITVGDGQIDLAISFGVDAGSDRSSANRLGSALVACDDAAREGLRWKAHDPETLKDVSWKLSLLGQLDRAIDSGDFWVAYQPILDLATGNLTGAEALARWTHPTKGPISPIDFILAAEQNDRIEKLTRHVLDSAISSAALINAAGIPFSISVNWSTRLIGDPGFVDLVGLLLKRHGLPTSRLTLEVTETAALGGEGGRLETLERLRAMGVNISIDDYGTGLSTLEYLRKIPATEIKIDQSFVAAVTKSPSDRVMVQSTIELVHSLGQTVVAEGVEDYATLDALQAMGCDFAQGFLISRPLHFEALIDMLGRTNVQRIKNIS